MRYELTVYEWAAVRLTDRKIQKIPLRTRRSFTRGTPRGLFGRNGAKGRYRTNNGHCSLPGAESAVNDPIETSQPEYLLAAEPQTRPTPISPSPNLRYPFCAAWRGPEALGLHDEVRTDERCPFPGLLRGKSGCRNRR
jgi:hypothetical protein